MGHQALREGAPLKIKIDKAQRHHYWMFDVHLLSVRCWAFDPPEADKCLLAFGEFDVQSFFRSRL